jgi:uncharacterized membrane protein YphA (DoxX/SURF4 family)
MEAAVAPEFEPTPLPQPVWSTARKLAFRAIFLYLTLYILSGVITNGFDDFPVVQQLAWPLLKLWRPIAPWVAVHVFHVTGEPATYFPTGSGDTTLHYVAVFDCAVLTVLGTLVWSLLDSARPNYRALDSALRLIVRFAAAAEMLSYGTYKVLPLQFQTPPYGRYLEPFGMMSPMSILWNFMGASVPYIIFTGVAETAGGLLLLFRRTATLGALVTFAVMLNVAALLL